MTIISAPSPNHDARGDASIDMLVLHYTGMQSGQAALKRLCEAEAKVSAHYLVEEDGRVFQLVDEDRRAWHAGVASWRGHSDVNARSVGIEIVNPGHEFGYRPFPEAQMEAVIGLCQGILSRHAIAARNVVGHSDVAPARKADPGELFDWAWLAREGVGIFPGYLPLHAERSNGPTASAGFWQTTLQALQRYGYTAEATDEQRITAFQRHFRQADVNGGWDAQCEAVLAALLDAL